MVKNDTARFFVILFPLQKYGGIITIPPPANEDNFNDRNLIRLTWFITVLLSETTYVNLYNKNVMIFLVFFILFLVVFFILFLFGFLILFLVVFLLYYFYLVFLIFLNNYRALFNLRSPYRQLRGGDILLQTHSSCVKIVVENTRLKTSCHLVFIIKSNNSKFVTKYFRKIQAKQTSKIDKTIIL